MGQCTSKETNSQSTGIIHHLFRWFRKIIALSHLSALLPVRMEQLVSHFKKFLGSFFLLTFIKICQYIQALLKISRKTDTLREDMLYFNTCPLFVFIITTASSVWRRIRDWRNNWTLKIYYSRFYLYYNFLACGVSIIIDCNLICC
jgi:hypothetical protein